MNGKKIYIANYGDDTTSYSCSADIPAGISELQVTSTKIFNSGKCHILLSAESPEIVSIDGIQITSSIEEIRLRIIID